jgi:uncharacterized protein (DUF342 family)
MAFFGSKKESDTKQQTVRPVVVKTENVAKELINIASINRVDAATLDFNVLDVQTLTRKKTASNNEMFSEISLAELAQLRDNTLLLDPDFEIKQNYEIEVFSKKARPNYDNLHFSIGVNATMCKIFLSIKSGSKVPFIETFSEDFVELINKKKIRSNLLIGLFDEKMQDIISQMNATMIVNKGLTFDANETFVIADGIEPEPTLDDALIYHYKNKDTKNNTNKVDYSKRNFIQSVVKDETLIEYLKPKKGSSGRNCKGEFLKAKEPQAQYAPTFKVSDKIAIIDNAENIQYKAIDNGYIVLENETYDIRDELDINEVSFKSTGSIETKFDADVTLKVKESDIFKDAVGMGMEVEVSEIEVEGNIGPKARVHAKKAKINGQTHQSSFVKADELYINIHKGEAHGGNVHITRLEQGTVVANSLDVTQATGGHLRAREITIDLMGSHVNVTASQRIEIKRMQGSENKLTIDPLAVESIDENVDEKEKELDMLDERLRFLKKEIERYKIVLQNNESSYLEVKKKLIHYKKNNIAMPDAFVESFKQYQKYEQHLKDLLSEENVKKEQREVINMAINSIQNNIYTARVINRDRWVGYNEIRFKLIDPPMDVVYAPHEGSLEKIFALVKTENDEYIIKAVKE